MINPSFGPCGRYTQAWRIRKARGVIDSLMDNLSTPESIGYSLDLN